MALEANPGVVDASRFRDYRRCGVNAISVGAQTFDADLLRFPGRVHSADETRRALSSIREAGFYNFSLDLIYGIPGQTVDGVSQDLSQALVCEPPHLSAYNLTIEAGPPFHPRNRQGLLHPLDEDVEIKMADRIQRRQRRGTTSPTGRAAIIWASASAPTATTAGWRTPWESPIGTSARPPGTCASPARPAMRSPRESARNCDRPWRMPVHGTADDRPGLGTSVPSAVRGEPRVRFRQLPTGSAKACLPSTPNRYTLRG